MVPDFKSDVYEYFVLLSADTVPDMLLRVNATAIHQGVTVRVGGEEVISGRHSRPFPLRVGENRILVTVTSSNKLTTRTYVITAYVLMESISSAALSVLTLSDGAVLEPEFEPSTYKYSAVVPHTRATVNLTAVSMMGTPVLVNGFTVRSGSRSPPVMLDYGRSVQA